MKSSFKSQARRKLSLLLGTALIVSGCSQHNPITNLEPVDKGKSYQAEYRDQKDYDKTIITPASDAMDTSKCLAQPVAGPAPALLPQEILTPGDVLDVLIGTDTALTGKYEVSTDGTLKVRNMKPIMAFGRTADQVNSDLSHALVASKFYHVAPPVSVRLTDYGPARIAVSGAVFEPGSVSVGGNAASDKDGVREDAIGAVTFGRRLSRAIQNAGGIRPDADLARVTLVRGNSRQVIDVRGAFTGRRFNDVILLEGDQIEVPSRNCFQGDLVSPSVISPPGTKVFMSNLIEPALSNANAAVNKDTRELRYGTRMFQALVGMNCVGGSRATNANRTAVLYTRNPRTGKSIVIQRNIEALVRNADRDNYDPYIMPNDALACYDSDAVDMMNVAKAFAITAGAYIVGKGL